MSNPISTVNSNFLRSDVRDVEKTAAVFSMVLPCVPAVDERYPGTGALHLPRSDCVSWQAQHEIPRRNSPDQYAFRLFAGGPAAVEISPAVTCTIQLFFSRWFPLSRYPVCSASGAFISGNGVSQCISGFCICEPVFIRLAVRQGLLQELPPEAVRV